MPSTVRSRIALVALFGVFLIPIVTSSLNGLTHVLTCQQSARQPFTIAIPPSGQPTILSALTLDRSQQGGLCGGLHLDIQVGADGPGHLRITLPITNRTRYLWRGSVKLVVGGVSVPVNIGTIHPGATAVRSVRVRVDRGTRELGGSLLIGP